MPVDETDAGTPDEVVDSGTPDEVTDAGSPEEETDAGSPPEEETDAGTPPEECKPGWGLGDDNHCHKKECPLAPPPCDDEPGNSGEHGQGKGACVSNGKGHEKH